MAFPIPARTGVLRATLVLLLLSGAAASAQDASPKADGDWRTSSALIGDTKYGQTFSRYDYVNPDAPKGGTLNAVAVGTFDSFNPFIVTGTPAAGLGTGFSGGLLYDTLMAQAPDESGVSHALIAEAFRYPADYSSATYRLNPNARWHDGQPITVDDVIWSFQTLKDLNPLYNKYFANVAEAAATGEREVTFRFNQKGNRELPHIIGDLVVLPKHWWTARNQAGVERDIARPTLEPPLGSGPFRIESFKPGSEVVWARVPDYWGSQLGANVGRYNFDRQRFVYFLSDDAAWQAFTKGGFSDIRFENRSQKWAQGYNFPAFQAGDIVKHEFPQASGEPMQGFVLNTRRPQFQDRRVRQALTYAFDFESMNRQLFYGLYTRTDSYFEGGDLASSGLPAGKELEILEQYRDKLPPELFTKEFKPPVFDSPQATRENLRRAFQLFKEAGWESRGGSLVDAKTGQPFAIEFLGNDPSDERVTLPFIENLKRLGVQASLRVVDPAQYVARLNNFDYDSFTAVLAQSQSPGNEQRDFWGSKAADTPGARNYSGINDPVVDALVERVIFTTDRDDLLAATHALDRVLLWNFYLVPQWHNPVAWVANWNKFGIPQKQPEYQGVDTESWWIDPAKEEALNAKYGKAN